jgi:hypothetical protein
VTPADPEANYAQEIGPGAWSKADHKKPLVIQRVNGLDGAWTAYFSTVSSNPCPKSWLYHPHRPVETLRRRRMVKAPLDWLTVLNVPWTGWKDISFTANTCVLSLVVPWSFRWHLNEKFRLISVSPCLIGTSECDSPWVLFVDISYDSCQMYLARTRSVEHMCTHWMATLPSILPTANPFAVVKHDITRVCHFRGETIVWIRHDSCHQ